MAACGIVIRTLLMLVCAFLLVSPVQGRETPNLTVPLNEGHVPMVMWPLMQEAKETECLKRGRRFLFGFNFTRREVDWFSWRRASGPVSGASAPCRR